MKDWWYAATSSNLLVRDLNGDGLTDVFMAVEDNPKLQDAQGHPCKRPDRDTGCDITWGEREIEVFYQQSDGSYRLGTRSSNLMMSRDEGGMDPDPFKGFTLTPKGSIRVTFNGGAGWTWEYVYTLQFRKDDVYLIGVYQVFLQWCEGRCRVLQGRRQRADGQVVERDMDRGWKGSKGPERRHEDHAAIPPEGRVCRYGPLRTASKAGLRFDEAYSGRPIGRILL